MSNCAMLAIACLVGVTSTADLKSQCHYKGPRDMPVCTLKPQNAPVDAQGRIDGKCKLKPGFCN